MKRLVQKGRAYKMPKGQIIQTTEDRLVFNFLKSGYVKRYLISNDGSIGTQVIYGPGDVFPVTLALSLINHEKVNPGPEIYYYEAMTPVEFHSIDQETFLEAVEKNPGIYRDLFILAGDRLRSTLNSLENVILRSSYKRLAHELAYLAKHFGKKRKSGMVIMPPITHQDLADMLSLTRETVSTNMVKLRKKGLISGRTNIYVPSIKKLEEEAFS